MGKREKIGRGPPRELKTEERRAATTYFSSEARRIDREERKKRKLKNKVMKTSTNMRRSLPLLCKREVLLLLRSGVGRPGLLLLSLSRTTSGRSSNQPRRETASAWPSAPTETHMALRRDLSTACHSSPREMATTRSSRTSRSTTTSARRSSRVKRS